MSLFTSVELRSLQGQFSTGTGRGGLAECWQQLAFWFWTNEEMARKQHQPWGKANVSATNNVKYVTIRPLSMFPVYVLIALLVHQSFITEKNPASCR
jgi:hypothetical protein